MDRSVTWFALSKLFQKSDDLDRSDWNLGFFDKETSIQFSYKGVFIIYFHNLPVHTVDGSDL